MAIYRGPGGAGDATVDATNAAALVAIRTQEATDAATAAAASAAEAAASAVIASTGLSGIAAYAAAAAGSAADASDSADAAAISESNANEDAGTASTKANEASASAAAAASSASAAASSAAAAFSNETASAASAASAADDADAAAASAASASTSAGNAAISEANAAAYASAASSPPATPITYGTLFGRTDTGTYTPPTALTGIGFGFWFSNPSAYSIYSDLAGDYNGPGAPGDINTAVSNGTIQVGQPLTLICTRLSTGLQETVPMGNVVSITTGGIGAVTITGTNAINWSLYADSGVWFGYKLIVHQLVVSGVVAENVTLGKDAGIGITTGGENVLIGAAAGNNVGSGRNNVVIGNASSASAQNVSNEVTLGNSNHTKTRLFGALAMGGSSVGTSGQVLTSQGSGAAPIWSNAGGTVTSVALSVPTGLTVSGSPVTTSGTLALSYTAGYSIPTTSSQTNWDTAYGWGNHASAGYLTGITSGQVTGALGYTPENAANKNAANGYAGLDSSGLVPSSILPSYVDDVLEYANLASFPGTGATGKIYVALDTNKTYRWSGSAYVEISASPGSTDAVTEGSTNLYFTDARARAAVSASGSISYNSSTGVISYTQPTNVSTFTNDSGYITSSALSPYLTSSTAASTYAPLTGTGTSGTWGISITGNAATVTNGLYSTGSYSNPTWLTSISGSIVSGNISGNAANVTGTVAVTNGGTGSTSLTANNVLLGNGTSALQVVAPGTNGNVLTSNGTTWVSSAPASSGISTGKSIAMAMIFGF